MAPWLRVLAVLLEDVGSIPSTHTAAHNSVTPVSGSTAHMVQTHMQAEHTHEIKIKKLKTF